MAAANKIRCRLVICHSELVSESQIEQICLIHLCYVKEIKRASKEARWN